MSPPSVPEKFTAETSVLFVCLGNICRSPLAEAAFRKSADQAGIADGADSAGTAAYHVGDPPDPRAIRTAARHGVDISQYRGRQLVEQDYYNFTHILALDNTNLAEIEARKPRGANAHIALLMDMVPGREGQSVADPYYDDEEGFCETWDDVWSAAQALTAQFARAA